jgi:hypothetical protein
VAGPKCPYNPTSQWCCGLVLKLKKITSYKPQQQQKTNNFIRKEKTSMPLA